jgi:nucleotide-binding universal stress UspA family protein
MNILVPVDGSPESEAAVNAVANRPWPKGSHLRIVSVIENIGPPPVGEFMVPPATDFDELRKQQTAQAENIVSQSEASLKGTGLLVEKKLREGRASDTIIDEATEWPADLIVMGTHGYTGFKKLVLGSVAQSVVSHAPCSVEVVRERGRNAA